MNTTRTRIQTAVGIVICSIAAVVAVVAWQKSRLRELAAENEQLRRAASEVVSLPEEASRTRSNEVDRAELERLRQWQVQTQPELMRLRGMAGGAQRANTEADQLRAELARQDSNAGTNQIGGPMGELMNHGMAQQVEGRVSRMAARLHLTPEQAQGVREILMRQAEVASVGFQQVFGGKYNRAEASKVVRNSEGQIKALLTAEQQAEYASYQQEEAASSARLVAHAEMFQMQSTLGLTTEQQDRVFSALYEVSLNLLSGSPTQTFTNPVDQAQWAVGQKISALESVLTAEQLESYRQQQAVHLKLIRDIIGKLSPASSNP
jgi:hypothetical protein